VIWRPRSRSQPASNRAFDGRHRHEVTAAEPADLSLDPTLLVRAAQADQRELRLEHVMRSQGDEAVGLDPPTTPEHLLDRRGQIVIADQRRDATEKLECASKNACWVSRKNAPANAAPE
jgi:hypothetical protein